MGKKPEIAPIEPPQTATIPVASVIAEPVPPVPAIAPGKSQVPNNVVAQRTGAVITASNRRVASDANRPRTTVIEIVVNLDASRVALRTVDGPPCRGTIDTDLAPGIYFITVDMRRKLWIFEPSQVNVGLRFSVVIDGPDPFSLSYAKLIVLTVHDKLGLDTQSELDKKVAAIAGAVANNEQGHVGALQMLCSLSEVDLYDVLDELWTKDPGVVNEILLKFEKAVTLSDISGQAVVLRALESFARPGKEIYVDSFDRCEVHPSSFAKEEERQKVGLTNIQLLLSFDLMPPRSIIIYADEVKNGSQPDTQPPAYGPCCLTYPRWLNLNTTPRLHAAKAAALSLIERQNAEFIIEAFKGVSNVLLSVFQSSASIGNIGSTQRASVRTSVRQGPGTWRPTFEGGSNMSEEAAAYELSSCGTPKGMGYYVENVQFEGFKNGTLLDAKFWVASGRQAKLLARRYPSEALKILGQAKRQVAVAQRYGAAVEWRVADPRTAELVRDLFQINNVPVRVIFIAP